MDWDKLRTFNAAVEAGSFSSAGFALNLSQSAVSRQISALEHDLKTSLFHRHARGLKLTEQGEALHEAAREVIARVSIAEARLAENRDQPRGELKISTDVAFGEFWLVSRLKEFHELYPEITLNLLFDGGDADLAMRKADVAIRLSAPHRSSAVQRRISTTDFDDAIWLLYPSRAYLPRRVRAFVDFVRPRLRSPGRSSAATRNT
jgi:DNA-binding transcriptional LysR family regulator